MEFLNSLIGTPLGWLMWLLNIIIPNYGVALILFTLIIKGALFPLNIKQQKNSAKMALFSPKLEELKKKHGTNKEKYQEEMMKLYQEEGYNPMSGCLPMLIQMLVLFGLIDVVYKPLTHISRIAGTAITSLLDSANKIGPNVIDGFKAITQNDYQRELRILNVFKTALKEDPSQVSTLGADILDKIKHIDLNFLGLNLGQTPEFSWNIYIIIPILSGLTALAASIVSQHMMTLNNRRGAELAKSKKQKEADAKAIARGEKPEPAPAVPGMNGTMKAMLYIMPLFSLYFTFQVPTGVGLYWTVANLFSIAQSIILYKMYSPEKIAVLVEKEMAENKKKKPSAMSRYMQAATEANKANMAKANTARGISQDASVEETAAEDAKVEVDGQQLSQKEYNRRKLAEARRRAAEKYGDTYVDDEEKK